MRGKTLRARSIAISTDTETMPEPTSSKLNALLAAVRGCRACEAHLPLGPRPVLRAAASARILIVGQAPGLRVHTTGLPWDDPSGARLRDWMGVTKDAFYDESRIAIIPMGYCYPGRGNGGDLPPRRECARLWLDHLLANLPRIELTILVGLYAQRHFLGARRQPTLAATIEAWREYSPTYLPLPHPSPRNTPWLQRHSWFEQQLLPELRMRVETILFHAGESSQQTAGLQCRSRTSRTQRRRGALGRIGAPNSPRPNSSRGVKSDKR